MTRNHAVSIIIVLLLIKFYLLFLFCWHILSDYFQFFYNRYIHGLNTEVGETAVCKFDTYRLSGFGWKGCIYHFVKRLAGRKEWYNHANFLCSVNFSPIWLTKSEKCQLQTNTKECWLEQIEISLKNSCRKFSMLHVWISVILTYSLHLYS